MTALLKNLLLTMGMLASQGTLQAAEAPVATSGTRLILLGTAAGPIPRIERSQPANLLVVGGRPYLIDAGDGVIRQLARTGLQPSDVRTVFITHHHLDHNADMANLIAFTWLEDNKRNDLSVPPTRFYGPPATADMVKASLQYMSVTERIFRAGVPMAPAIGHFEGIDIASEGPFYKDDRLTVSAIENTHYAGLRHAEPEHPDKSYSYRFDTPDRSIVFTGDTGYNEKLVKFAADADVLVSEVNEIDASMREITRTAKLPEAALNAVRMHMEKKHITPEEIGRMAQKARVKMVVLTHVSPGLDGETDMSVYTAGVHKYFTGPVILGKDLSEF